MAVAKRQRREKPVKTSGKTNSPPGQPSSHGAGSRGGEKHTKRGAKIELGVSLLFTARPHSSRMYFPLLANKLSYNTGPSITSNFCCGKTKLRKLQTTLRAGNNSYIVITMQILDIDLKNCARTTLKSVLIRVLQRNRTNRIDIYLYIVTDTDVLCCALSCPTLCDPMDSNPPGSSVHGLFQAKILEWVAIPFSRGFSQFRD